MDHNDSGGRDVITGTGLDDASAFYYPEWLTLLLMELHQPCPMSTPNS